MARRRADPIIAEISKDAIEALVERCAKVISAEDHALLKALVASYLLVALLVRKGRANIRRLRRLFGLRQSEKTQDLFPGAAEGQTVDPAMNAASGAAANAGSENIGSLAGGGPGQPGQPSQVSRPETSPLPPRKGHGRRPASAYVEAEHVFVPHQSLRVGDRSPCCERGRLYGLKNPMVFLRIVGQPLLFAKSWDCQQLRCSGCGAVYTAKPPPEACGPKHTESAAAVIAVTRFGLGTPHYRLDRFQEAMGTPVPDATQWDVLFARVKEVLPVYRELLRLAAQAPLLHNDDTGMRVLQFLGKRREKLVEKGQLPRPDRTGLYTSGIVAVVPAGQIVLFITGRRHAGENLAALLDLREKELASPLLMCDALDRNLPKGHPVEEANCLCHGRRGVVAEAENYPAECRHVLDEIGHVYAVEKACREEQLSPEARLFMHQLSSAPVMKRLRTWMTAELEEKRVEPNSDLGKAFLYMLKRKYSPNRAKSLSVDFPAQGVGSARGQLRRWDKLTVFLRKPGAPLDNNVVERMLKLAVLHRKNSLFYRSERGAVVGDVYMTLIHNAVIHGKNPIDYLTALMVHEKAVAAAPAQWMPWCYRQTLAAVVGAKASTTPALATNAASVAATAPAAPTPVPAMMPTPGDALLALPPLAPRAPTPSASATPPPSSAIGQTFPSPPSPQAFTHSPTSPPLATAPEVAPPSPASASTSLLPTTAPAAALPANTATSCHAASPPASARAPDDDGAQTRRSSRRSARTKPNLVPPPAFMLFVLFLVLVGATRPPVFAAELSAHPACRLASLACSSPPTQDCRRELAAHNHHRARVRARALALARSR